MVDLLGRMAHLREARELIRNMPFAPDAIVWQTFLSACKIHKNMELVEEATVNLLKLEPHMDGNYVLLSNMYAQDKKWDDVVNQERDMSDEVELQPNEVMVEVQQGHPNEVTNAVHPAEVHQGPSDEVTTDEVQQSKYVGEPFDGPSFDLRK
ncbi:hypothetical protein IFM89_023869 [Coptis chinensis]|uniref:Pentatricopeptide repeat-containing protein n=1 Tax=Coptis chinensis TaxID=261450 RepID=A0A835GXV6_9MAGN|nr:hypothetical protein IFM89_023869 [Coptis chinensis]